MYSVVGGWSQLKRFTIIDEGYPQESELINSHSYGGIALDMITDVNYYKLLVVSGFTDDD